ncbi:IS3 family transposase, partial [Shigella dysenteriae]
DEAISVIREYIEIFYNRQRRHSRLGNISPAAFREKYHQMAVLKKRTNGSVRYCQYTSNRKGHGLHTKEKLFAG